MFTNMYLNCVYLSLILFGNKQQWNDEDINLSKYNKYQVFKVNNKNVHDKCNNQGDRINMFIERSLKKLVDKLNMISDNTTGLEIDIKSRISLRHVNVLRHYLQQNNEHLNCHQLEEFEDTLDAVIDSLITSDSEISDNSVNTFTSNSLLIFGYFSVLLFTYYSVRHSINVFLRLTEYRNFFTKRVAIISTIFMVIFISVLIKWRQKYLIELSRKQCYVLSTPEECRNTVPSVTFMSWIRHYMYSYEEKRHNYYRSVTVDPFWEINPITVISELLAELVFTPLKTLGQYSG